MNIPIHYVFLLSFIIALALSYSSIRNILHVLKASAIDDNFYSPETPEKLSGTITENTIKSPLTQTACALWQIQVFVKAGKHTRKIFEQTSTTPFTISAEGEKIRLHPEGAELLMHDYTANKWTNGFMGNPFHFKKMDHTILSAIREMGVEINEFTELGGVQVVENHLMAGDDVFAAGRMEFEEGMKSMHGDETNLLVISNWREKEYLWRQAGWLILRIIAMEFVGFFLYLWLDKSF